MVAFPDSIYTATNGSCQGFRKFFRLDADFDAGLSRIDLRERPVGRRVWILRPDFSDVDVFGVQLGFGAFICSSAGLEQGLDFAIAYVVFADGGIDLDGIDRAVAGEIGMVVEIRGVEDIRAIVFGWITFFDKRCDAVYVECVVCSD